MTIKKVTVYTPGGYMIYQVGVDDVKEISLLSDGKQVEIDYESGDFIIYNNCASRFEMLEEV